MFDLLVAYGVQADAFAGHSYGELVALCAAGIIDEEALWTASRIRGESMAVNGVDRGTMAAVSAPLNEIESVLEGLKDNVVLANRNHPRQGVISGSRKGIANAIAAMNDAGFSAREIPVSAAFHSSLVADAQKPFAKALEALEFTEPQTTVYSNVTAQPYEAKGQRDLLAQQITSTVDFVGLVESMVAQGIRTFVECGPKGVLSGLLKRCLKGVEGTQILSMDGKASKVDGDLQFKHLLAQLAAAGVPINVQAILNEQAPTLPRPKGSRATIELGGANYKRPETLAPKTPEIKRPPTTRPVLSAPPTAPKAAVSTAPPTAAKGTSKMNDETLNALLEATRQSLVAFQKTQEQTAEVHAQFLQAHSKANENFASLFQAHSALLHTALGQELPLPKPLALPTAPAQTREALTEALMQPTATHTSNLPLPSNERVKAAPSAELPPVMRASTLSDLIKTGGSLPTTPTPTVQPTAHTIDVGDVLLSIVADKTGYPRDLVQFPMDLESDLGIDSIKRVEILSAVQEALPGLPELDPEKAASLRTLADIRDLLIASTPGLNKASEAAAAPPIAQLLIETIAEKTGYPVDLIEVGMDLESDLGIDSIKRVEILSAIQEALPQVGELDTEVFGGLRTVQTLIDELETLHPAVGNGQGQVPSIDFLALLTDIVAERTGYPSDLVEPGMDLESDLGIDSIKRVEILSAVQDALPDLPDLDEEAYSAARTIGEIAELLSTAAGGTASASTPARPSPAPSVPVKAKTLPIRREVLVRPAPEGTGVELPDNLVLIADSSGVTKALSKTLKKHKLNHKVLSLKWDVPLLPQIPEGTQGLVFAATIGASSDTMTQRLQGAFELAKGLPELNLFASLTGLGGTFGHERFTGEALEGALPGLIKTLAQERPNTRCIAIDVDPAQVEAENILTELATHRGVFEVGLTDEPVTLQASPIAINPESQPLRPLETGDLVVVSGGARGVTAAVVSEMARRWSPSFLLLGRSPWPESDPDWATDCDDAQLKGRCIEHLKSLGQAFKPTEVQTQVDRVLREREMRNNVTALQDAGLRVAYRSVNVRDAHSVADAVTELTKEWGPVRGLVHGAGVIADKLIDEKTVEQFDFVFGTKVEGLQNLLASIDTEQLKLLAVFSSVAGRYGNRGQVDYAMANEAITHIAHQYAPSLQTKAFHWGPWAGGMVTASLKAVLEARGMQVIPLKAGADQFCDEFERGGPSVEVVIGGPDQAAGLLAGGEAAQQFPALQEGSKKHTIDGSLGFLDDHRIGGKPVLPFVMALEWMVSAAQEAYPDYHIAGVQDLAVLKGVVLDQKDKTLTLEWTPVATKNGANGALLFRLLGDIGPMNLPTVHYKGTVELSRTPIGTNRFPGSNGLGKTSYPYTVKEAYERFLFHGPGLQGINNIVGMSDHGIVGILETSRPKQLGVNKSLWETDPVALDSALQLVGLWVREKRGASALPCYVEEYQQFAPFRSEVTCHIEMEPTKTARGRFQATFVDAQGRVVASVNGGQYASRKGLNENFKSPAERPN